MFTFYWGITEVDKRKRKQFEYNAGLQNNVFSWKNSFYFLKKTS